MQCCINSCSRGIIGSKNVIRDKAIFSVILPAIIYTAIILGLIAFVPRFYKRYGFKDVKVVFAGTVTLSVIIVAIKILPCCSSPLDRKRVNIKQEMRSVTEKLKRNIEELKRKKEEITKLRIEIEFVVRDQEARIRELTIKLQKLTIELQDMGIEVTESNSTMYESKQDGSTRDDPLSERINFLERRYNKLILEQRILYENVVSMRKTLEGLWKKEARLDRSTATGLCVTL